jgi:hypothetical protein
MSRNDEILRNYDVRIVFHNYGCVVQVGCKSYAFESVETAMKELTHYAQNPESAIKNWCPEILVSEESISEELTVPSEEVRSIG